VSSSETKTETVEIEVNNKPVVVPKKTTGAEIKAKAGVATDFQLFRIAGNTEHPVADDDEITVHAGQRFVASPTLDPS
jgi:hypothetical protein